MAAASDEDVSLPRNAQSQTDGLDTGSEARDSKMQLMKMLTFANDVVGPSASPMHFSMTVDSLNEYVNEDNSLENGNEVGRIKDEAREDRVEDKEVTEEQDIGPTKEEIEEEKEVDEEEEEEEKEVEQEEEEEEAEEEEEEEEEEKEEEEEEEEEVVEEEEEESEEDHRYVEEKVLMDYEFPTIKDIKVKSDTDLSKIPSEIYGDRNAMLTMLRELVSGRPSLSLRNKYLEFKCFRHLQLTQVTGSPPIDDGSNLEDEAERERYMHFLGFYRKESENFRARDDQIKAALDVQRERVKERLSADAEAFGDLTSRENAVAVDLVFATTGRRLTQKRVEEMIRRQTARRKQVAHARYVFIRQWYKFEEIDAWIRRLETLGPGMKISDYEADLSVNLTAKTKIDERNKELQKARSRVCGIMAAITHGKVKLSFLHDEIKGEKSRHDQIIDLVYKRREDLSAMRAQLSNTRNRYLRKREQAGLMLATPVLREMERVSMLRDFWKDQVDHLQSEISEPQSGTDEKRTQLREVMPFRKKSKALGNPPGLF